MSRRSLWLFYFYTFTPDNTLLRVLIPFLVEIVA